MRKIENTLYVTIPKAYLRLDNDTVHIEVEHETKLRVPLHHLGAVVCLGNVMVSTPLMRRLATDGVSLVFCEENGRFRARLEGPVSGNVLLRRAQHERYREPEFGLAVAKSFVAGKIRNSRQVLLRGAREAKSDEDRDALTHGSISLAAGLRALRSASDLDGVRGIEGEAAREYYAAFNSLIRADLRSDFSFGGRNRRPPLDPMNALLSFVYSLTMNDCRSAIETVGLDPQLGILHALRPGRAALALDLVEEFRPLADRLALTLINRAQLRVRDFLEREGGAVQFTDDARKAVIVAYQEKKQEELAHPLLSEPVPLGLIPIVQARLLARTIRGESPAYVPFLVR